jgi:hypothetical protein
VPLDDALWLEVKVLAQFGAGGPNRGWTRSLLAPPTADIAKLANEPLVRERALAIVLFTQSHDIAAHDLDVWHEHVQQKGLALQPVTLRHVVIGDRRGNAFCSVGLFEVARNFDVDGAEMEA